MKKIFLTVLICLTLVASAYAGMVEEIPLKDDLIGKRILGAGEIERVSGATYIHEGVLATADGDDSPFSHTSVENETGATEMRGSFVDGQAWFHDAGGLIAVYADTGNLLKLDDGAGTDYAYGFIGEVGTGEVATALTNNVTGITKANPGVVSSIAHGLVVGDLVFFDSLNEMTELNDAYQTVTVLDSANTFSIGDTSDYDAETTGGACAHEVTEPAAEAVHIYKEYTLTTEGWNSIDTSIDFNAAASWDFDIYTNLLTATGSTAQSTFEDGWLSFEPEGTNIILYSEDFSQWSASEATLDTSEADPRGGTGATGLVASVVAGTHYVFASPTLKDNANVTFSVFAKAGAQDWIRLMYNTKANAFVSCYFELAGSGATGTNTTTKESIERLGTTDWYRCRVTHNIGAGATAPKLYINSAEADNDASFSGDAATIDTYIYGADAKQDLFLTSYVPTNGIPVVRTTEAGSAADNGYSWTIVAHTPLDAIFDDAVPPAAATDSQGTLTFEVKWGCDESDIAASAGLITVRNSYGSIAYFTGSAFATSDGALFSTINHPAFSAGDIIHYVVRWGNVDGTDNKLSVGYSDDAGATWNFDATPADYDGAFTVGSDLRIGYDSLYPFHIRNIKFYDVAYSQAQIEAGLGKNVLLWMIPFEIP